MKRKLYLVFMMLCAGANAQLTVTVLPPKVAGQKAAVPLGLKNDFAEAIQSARAVVFLFDEQGKVLGQDTRWIIGGSQGMTGLAAGATNVFHFVVAGQKPFLTTNLTTKVSITRLVLDGGKVVDPTKAVQIIEPAGKLPQPIQR
jgi:hypothetical protein